MIFDFWRKVAGQHPDQIAVVDGSQRITYGELLSRVQATREWLRRTIDPKPGDVIAVALENSWEFVACFFAASELGAVPALCNPRWRAGELRSLATRLGFRAAVIESGAASEWHQILDLLPKANLLTMDKVQIGSGGSLSLPVDSFSEQAPACYLFTSGSTGAPRVVPRSHGNLLAVAESVGETLRIGPARRFLSVVPFFSSNGFHNGLLVPLLRGATVVTARQFSPGACVELAQREKVDTLFGSPFIFGCLADSNLDKAPLASLQYCFSGGARLAPNVAGSWRDRFGISIRQNYGMSETGLITVELTAPTQESSLGTCVGEPARNVEVAIVGTGGERLGIGEAGELAVRSASVMAGYFREPELNRTCFHDGFFRTGDLGCFDATGRVYLTGRQGRGINIAGTKVDPVEVETVVEMLPNVASCHVDAVPNDQGGAVLRARVVPLAGRPVTRREIIEQCRTQLAEYKLPRIIEFLETSPATIAGKIPRH